jgi:hypothetical protein
LDKVSTKKKEEQNEGQRLSESESESFKSRGLFFWFYKTWPPPLFSPSPVIYFLSACVWLGCDTSQLHWHFILVATHFFFSLAVSCIRGLFDNSNFNLSLVCEIEITNFRALPNTSGQSGQTQILYHRHSSPTSLASSISSASKSSTPLASFGFIRYFIYCAQKNEARVHIPYRKKTTLERATPFRPLFASCRI